MPTLKGRKTKWIDIFKPNSQDLAAIKKLHKFHPLILNELMTPSARARVEEHDDYIFIAHHIPVYDVQTKTSRRSEVDFLITKDMIITARYEPLEQIDGFLQDLARDPKMQRDLLSGDSYIMLHQIFEKIMDFSLRQLRHIEERVEFIAHNIFKREGNLLAQISGIKRDVLDYRLIVRPHTELFESLRKVGIRFWGKKSEVYLNNLSGENLRVIQYLENYYEIVESLEATNAQLLNAATNAVIKRFTIIAFLFSIPLFFIFSMGVPYIDAIINTPSKFWSIFALIIALISWAAWLFKKKKLF